MSTPHLKIQLPEDDFTIIKAELENELNHSNLEIEYVKHKSSTWASLDWLVPGVLIVVVLKPYFQGFLSEAGKSHFKFLAKKINGLLARAKLMNVRYFNARGEIKFDKYKSQSKAINLIFQTKGEITLRVLFNEDLDLNIWQEAAQKLLDLLWDYYNSDDHDQLSEYLEQFPEDEKRTIYIVIEPETHNLDFIDDLIEYHRRSSQQ